MQKVFTRVDNPDSPACAQALAIYEKAFPARERHPRAVIRQRLAKGASELFVGEEETVVFMALLWPLADTDCILLDYLATAPAARGQGWASRFLQEIFAQSSAQQRFIVLEVEDPDFGSNRAERSRRLEFYRKNGARELQSVHYILPPLQGAEPTEMRLLISPNYPAKSMDAALARHLITRLYEDLYGRMANDLLLQSFLPQIREPVPLR